MKVSNVIIIIIINTIMDVVAAKKVRWMFEIYDLVRVDHFVECHQGSHMANILVVLEKCPLSDKDADWIALWCLIKPPTISVICPKTTELTIVQSDKSHIHNLHLPPNRPEDGYILPIRSQTPSPACFPVYFIIITIISCPPTLPKFGGTYACTIKSDPFCRERG
jgi:hypothetical protein